MEIAGDYTFDAPQEIVWDALQDPNVLGSIMPGGQGVERIGENQYKSVLQVKVGPVQGIFEGEINLSDIKPPEGYHMEVDGKGAPGFVKASGNLHLEGRDHQTYMQYSGQAQVGGRMASVGQRLIDASARSIIRQSLDALNEYLKVQVAQQPQPAAASQVLSGDATPITAPPSNEAGEYKPPSQTTLAFNVARDVFNDFVPAKYQPFLLGAGVIVIALIIWLIVSR